MRKLMWLLSGVALGFVAAHFVNRTPEGRRFFDRLNRGVDEFGRAFAAGYHDVEAQATGEGAADTPSDAKQQ